MKNVNSPLYFRTHAHWHALYYSGDQWVVTRLRLPQKKDSSGEPLKGAALDEYYMSWNADPSLGEECTNSRKYFLRLEHALEYLVDHTMGLTWVPEGQSELEQLRTRINAAADMLQRAIFDAEKSHA